MGQTQVIDLATLDTQASSEAGAELELVHPATGDPLGIFITLAGSDSGQWRKAVADVATRRGRKKVSAEDARRDGIEIIARCTLTWRNVRVDGEDLPCTLENARKVYSRFNWMREQADAFCVDRANFLPA